MKNQLLVADAHGELGKLVSAFLGIASLSLCGLAGFLVWRALPREASLAHAALPVLLVGAIPGLFQIFALAVKVYQGGRVQLRYQRNRTTL